MGNAYDEDIADGLHIHRNGPHIFRTNPTRAWDSRARFTDWQPYEHRVRACLGGPLVPIPINLDTINALYGLSQTAFEVETFSLLSPSRVKRSARARTWS